MTLTRSMQRSLTSIEGVGYSVLSLAVRIRERLNAAIVCARRSRDEIILVRHGLEDILAGGDALNLARVALTHCARAGALNRIVGEHLRDAQMATDEAGASVRSLNRQFERVLVGRGSDDGS